MTVIPIGSETRVNTYVDGFQQDSAIATDREGNYIIVWKSVDQDGDKGGVFAQRYKADGNALGREFQVNSTTIGQQGSPRVAMASDGSFVVIWKSDKNLYGQRYAANGDAIENEFLINTKTEVYSLSDIAITDSKEFVITWTTSETGVAARRYSSAGRALDTEEFRVDAATASEYRLPKVDVDAEGNFVITWTQNRNGDYESVARRFQADGSPAKSPDGGTGEFSIGSGETTKSRVSDVAVSPKGDFVTTWFDTEKTGVYAQRYRADGTRLGIEFRVNDPSFSAITASRVAMDKNGNFGITWTSNRNVYVQHYLANGKKQGDAVLANTTDGGHTVSSIAMTEDGDSILTWTKILTGNFDIYARRFDVPNTVFGSDDRDDRLDGTDGRDHIQGLAGDDTLRGFDGDDLIEGGDGLDSLEGGNGNDTLYGGRGNDDLSGGSGSDRLIGGAGRDSYTVQDANTVVEEDAISSTSQDRDLVRAYLWEAGKSSMATYILPEHIEDLTLRTNNDSDRQRKLVATGIGNDSNNNLEGVVNHRNKLEGLEGRDNLIGGHKKDKLYGNEGVDWLMGDRPNARTGSADRLDGGADDDRLEGGSGNDRLKGGADNDHLHGDAGNDKLKGNSGDDMLVGGVITTEAEPDIQDVDVLIGGSGADHFVLGAFGTQTAYENEPNLKGNERYALIRDFQKNKDRIFLGQRNYMLDQSPIRKHQGTGIFLEKEVNGSTTRDLIGVVKGVNPGALDLADESQFVIGNRVLPSTSDRWSE